ncbi:HNH endonuclease [uncultured Desulfobacter sp.]|uniref:HNH endonuclease n=1 Tax=uncultured Desulfobacter sp. TaxID=240139 RepID=UPI0029C7C7D4|nr:HNH endonuclease [uncultured Desulfobacter sp.]
MPRSIKPKDQETYRGYFSAYRAGILNARLTEDLVKNALEHKIGQKVSPESRIAETTILSIEDKGIRISTPSRKPLITYEQILNADEIMRFYLPDEIPNADTRNGGRNNDFRQPVSGSQASHVNNSGYAPALAELVWRELCDAPSDNGAKNISSRIEQLVEVIEEVKDQAMNSDRQVPIRKIRIAAGYSVASRRNVTNKTVIDKFVRQLRPSIKSAQHFDSLLEDWLYNDSFELRNIMLSHSVTPDDETLIYKTFHKASNHDYLLSEEFGYSPDQVEYKEGKEKLQIHLTKERNRYLVKLAKERWARESQGDILCSICSFSFVEAYGDIGKDFIEAHHKIPISELNEETIIRVEDLEPLCSNCHRMIHRRRPWLTVDELRNIWHKNQLNTG